MKSQIGQKKYFCETNTQKMTRRITSILAIALLAFSLNSCKGKDKIVGEWTLMDIDYSEHLKHIDPILKESFIDMMDRQGSRILQHTFFEFIEPEKLIITSPNFKGGSSSETGRWAMNDAKDSLVLENGGLESYAVVFQDDKTMLLHSAEPPLRILTFKKK